ncbi:MAG: prolipoprotein diacylglyceryl transferase [Clostridia bacterium]|nr:prolipoprotein diacylglyceryl transferase [Clostridia bacterium]
MNLPAFFLWTAASVLAGSAVFWLCGRELTAGLRTRTLILALAFGVLCARAFYVLARLGFFIEIGGTAWLWPADPEWSEWGVGLGFALWGAVGGAALSGWLCTMRKPEERRRMMDLLALGGCLAIGLYRFGEFLIGEGTGPYVESDAFCFFPIAVMNEWGEWICAVFVWEGLSALIIFLILWRGRNRRAPGETARLFLILFCASQILWESLRRDSFLRWMFVRVSQVTAAIVLAALIVQGIRRTHTHPDLWNRRKKELITCCAVFLICTGACIALEFAMDKSAYLSLEACYGLEALCCIALGITACRAAMHSHNLTDKE